MDEKSTKIPTKIPSKMSSKIHKETEPDEVLLKEISV